MVLVRTHDGGASPRPPADRRRRPLARGAAVTTLAAALVLGGGGAASALAGVPGGPVVGPVVGPVDDDATTAADRLAARGDLWSRDRLADALAVGRAALDAADASSALVAQGPELDGLRVAVAELRDLVRTHEGVVPRQRAGGGSAVLADAATLPPALTMPERLAVLDQVATLAADVFRVALEVEATAAASGSALPGLDAPALQLTLPRPLEALAPVAPATPTAADVPAAPADGAPVAGVPGVQAAGEPTAPVPAEQAPGAAVVPTPHTPADQDAPAAPVDPAAAPAAADGVTPSALPVELAEGLADLEAAVAAASGSTTGLVALDARPVLPSALRAAAVGRWSSFLPGSWSTLGLANGRIPEALLCAPDFAPAALLRCDAAAALEAVNEAYRADFGEDLVITSGYRTFDQQAALRVSKGWLAAPAGQSNHGLGVAVDLGGFGGLGQFDSPRYRWMLENGEAFGWVHPEAMRPGGGGPPEPWHFEFGTD